MKELTLERPRALAERAGLENDQPIRTLPHSPAVLYPLAPEAAVIVRAAGAMTDSAKPVNSETVFAMPRYDCISDQSCCSPARLAAHDSAETMYGAVERTYSTRFVSLVAETPFNVEVSSTLAICGFALPLMVLPIVAAMRSVYADLGRST